MTMSDPTCAATAAAATDPDITAIQTDVQGCSMALEDAYYASSQAACQQGLVTAAAWLRRAQDHAGARGDEDLAARAACVAAALEAQVSQVPSDPAALLTFQKQYVYPFQGSLTSLASVAWSHDQTGAGLVLAGVAVPLLVVLLAQAHSDVRGYRGQPASRRLR